MTYRVVHINAAPVSGGATGGTTPTISVNSQASHQDVLTGASASSSAGAEHTQMAYIAGGNADVSISPTGGFYVIGSPHDVMSVAAAASASSSGSSTISAGSRLRHAGPGVLEAPRDDRRRATHNEVERRRRDKINNWIAKLAKILPDSSGSGDLSKSNLSKGAVLAQACDYIADSRHYHAKYVEAARENEKLQEDIKMLKQSNEALVTANQLLKAHLKNQGALLEPSGNS